MAKGSGYGEAGMRLRGKAGLGFLGLVARLRSESRNGDGGSVG
jgi:hypothetical protein